MNFKDYIKEKFSHNLDYVLDNYLWEALCIGKYEGKCQDGSRDLESDTCNLQNNKVGSPNRAIASVGDKAIKLIRGAEFFRNANSEIIQNHKIPADDTENNSPAHEAAVVNAGGGTKISGATAEEIEKNTQSYESDEYLAGLCDKHGFIDYAYELKDGVITYDKRIRERGREVKSTLFEAIVGAIYMSLDDRGEDLHKLKEYISTFIT